MTKTRLKVSVVGRDDGAAKRWIRDIESAARGAGDFFEINVDQAPTERAEWGQVVAIDAETPRLAELLSTLELSGETKGRAVFLIVPEHAGTPELLERGLVDDVLVYPFRPLEVLSKLRQYQQLMMWDEVQAINVSFAQMIARFQESLALAERLQKSQLPVRFPNVKGFEFSHRYMAGTRPGGDYLDVAESKDGSQVSVLLTDSSSYGLSSSVLAALMEVTSRLTIDQVRSCGDIVLGIQDVLLRTLAENDTLSLLYAVVSRKDLTLRYVNLGSSQLFWVPPTTKTGAAPVQLLKATGRKLSVTAPWGSDATPGGISAGGGAAGVMSLLELPEESLRLEAGGRLWFASEGFVGNGPAADARFREGLMQFRTREATDFINEQVFRVKQNAGASEMPEKDATLLALHVDQHLKRVV